MREIIGRWISVFNGIALVTLAAFLLSACSSIGNQAKTTPTVTINEIVTPVSSLDQLTGKWLTGCNGACIFEINADGTYTTKYMDPPREGNQLIETGTLTITDGVVHIVAISGKCHPDKDGYYTASLIEKYEKLFLKFTPSPFDECAARQKGMARQLEFIDE